MAAPASAAFALRLYRLAEASRNVHCGDSASNTRSCRHNHSQRVRFVIGHLASLKRHRLERLITSRRKRIVFRCQAVSKIIEVGVIAAMDGPSIPEDECLQLDEIV